MKKPTHASRALVLAALPVEFAARHLFKIIAEVMKWEI